MRSCIFCDGQASTKEDAWPRWLMRLIGSSANSLIYAERGGQVYRPWHTNKLQVKFVCADCNNGWMSRLENRVKPIIESLLIEESVSLDASDQKELAVWSVKNAMVFEALRSDPVWFYDKSERSAFRESLLPTLKTSVWIAKCVDYEGAYCSASNLSGVTNIGEGQVKTYVTTMGFGSLAIQVLNCKLPSVIAPTIAVTADQRPGQWNETTLRIWPVQQRTVIWPASIGLRGEVGLEALSKRWSPIKHN